MKAEKIKKWIVNFIVIVAFLIAARFVFFTSSKEVEDGEYSRQTFEDGKYTAEVSYKNTCTGHRNYYDLTVVIEGDYLTTIIFENGGSIGKNKINTEKVNKEGKVLIKAKDGCSEYYIHIQHKE
ncbi:hypothetical protein [Dysgonomonas sp. 511]|uniref:hypothetical protein n=1 Tax=Dysgonomonas sp. 511 TaxID=2302930 RepID=UPI0013D3B1F8|nr:hypothetical protein [Dysgonomonas sp. 511]NDV77863.1 hypothetical protein [Dysgonomonas sp. 511]